MNNNVYNFVKDLSSISEAVNIVTCRRMQKVAEEVCDVSDASVQNLT
jgi:hypothetical protein